MEFAKSENVDSSVAHFQNARYLGCSKGYQFGRTKLWGLLAMKRLLLFSLLFGAGCSERQIIFKDETPPTPREASISGRVCDDSGRTWLADARVYTNIFDDNGKVTGVREAFSDRDGYWSLPNLTPDREYTIYVSYETSVIWQQTLWVADGEELRIEEPPCFDPQELNIAVIAGDYDDMHLVLQNMGFINYTLVDGTKGPELSAFLTDPSNLAPFDIIFFNGGHQEEGIIYDTNPANEVPDTVAQNLKDYVWNGGSLYASDWAYDVIESTWPDAMDFLGDDTYPNAAQYGDYDLVNAQVMDESLASYLNASEVEIEFDLPVWPPILTVEGYVSIHLAGNVHYKQGSSSYTLPAVPILASFSGGEGRVIFSSYRAVANQDQIKETIIQYLLFGISNGG